MPQLVDTIRFSEYGGPEVLSFQKMELPSPGSGELRIKHLAIGVNYIDIYHRKGVFAAKLPLPNGLGVEGVGEVVECGADVAGFVVGDRVAYVGGAPGGYSVFRNITAARCLRVPDGLDSETVAATVFKGLTAEYLTHRCVSLKQGDTVLFHAAAGGVGSLATQWLKSLGVGVIGTVSTEAKAEIAHAQGCHDVIIYSREDFRQKVSDITSGKGVRVVFDSVGSDTFAKSLDCLQPCGTLVSFGESSGPVDPLQVGTLGAKGSLFVTRPSIAHYTADRTEYELAAQRLFSALETGVLKVAKPTIYSLTDVRQAHADMEARKTSGSVILQP
ncbi:quinone oxidoreductase family protein [Brucella grignonensis]|uniref:Zinc-binding dehydrogenase family protein n=1 Tax=Brucella grignonensis TaxID=94627 RepID=A0A256EZ43_9HYPH|nr:quinone oxidoreductase [Brucella grignonensis]NKB84507.1 quinone oxidoreductase [Brucella grignonensis]OYR07884.1 zinc-binding dehydrogenase family protein [Brucella grignonensis]